MRRPDANVGLREARLEAVLALMAAAMMMMR